MEKNLKKIKKITGRSQHMKNIGHSPAWNLVRVIYRDRKWKNRKFKEAARIASHNKEPLMNKKDERKTIMEHSFKRYNLIELKIRCGN